MTGANVRRALAAVRAPGGAWLIARMLGWALVLPLLKFALPLRTLAGVMWLQSSRDHRTPDLEDRVAELAALAHRGAWLGMRENCLERSLLLYRYLSRVNAQPELVVGTRADGGPIFGHVWVSVDGRPVRERPGVVHEFEPITVFGSGGAVRPA